MLIQRMRDGSEGILAKIIIGLIIIVFALFGFGSITTFLAPTPKVATVNGSEVSQQEMELEVERRRRMLLARDISPAEIDEDALREAVLNTLISRALLTQAAEELSLQVSESAIDAEIVSTEIFQFDGQFDGQQFQQVIAGAGYTPLSYREAMRTDKLFEQMSSGIGGSAFVTEEEANRYRGLLSQRRDIAFIRVSAADLIDEVSIEDSDIQDYYNQNRQDFVTTEKINLQYLELSREALAASLDVIEADLLQYFEDNKSDYATNESRRVAHILVETGDELTEEAAEAKARGIYDRIIEGEDYTALAMEMSDDLGSRENGGDLGFNEQGTFDDEFEAVAYDLALSQVSEPVRTELGFHIIKVLDIRAASMPSFEDVRAELDMRYRMAQTQEEFVIASSRLADLLFQNYAELESTAETLGLEVRETGLLARDASHFLFSDSRVAEAAFSPDVLMDGNNSDLIELSDDLHLGIRVAEHQPSVTRPLAEAREDIRYILQRTRAADLADQRARNIVSEIESGSLAQFVADQYDLAWQVVPGAARAADTDTIDPQILTEAFKLPRPADDKETLGVATMLEGDALVLRVSGVTNPTDDVSEAELTGLQLALSRQLGSGEFVDFQESLRKDADLEKTN